MFPSDLRGTCVRRSTGYRFVTGGSKDPNVFSEDSAMNKVFASVESGTDTIRILPFSMRTLQ